MEVKLTRITKEITREYEEGTNNYKDKDIRKIDVNGKNLITITEGRSTEKEENDKTIYKDEGIWKHGYEPIDERKEYNYSYTNIIDNNTGSVRTININEEPEEIGDDKIEEHTYDTLTDKYGNMLNRVESVKHSDGTIENRTTIKTDVKEDDKIFKVKTIQSESEDYNITNYDLSDNKNEAVLQIINEKIDNKNRTCSKLSYKTDDGKEITLDDDQVGLFKDISDIENNFSATIQYEPVALYLEQRDSNNNSVMYEKYDKTPDGFKLTLSEKYENTLDEQNRVVKTIGRELIDNNNKPEDWYQNINSTNSSLYEIYKDKLL